MEMESEARISRQRRVFRGKKEREKKEYFAQSE